MRRTHRACLSITLSLLLLAATSPAYVRTEAAASTPTTDAATDAAARAAEANGLVGSFKVHVNVQERAVRVESRGGTHAASAASTRLAASFAAWDAPSRVASLDVAVVNTGAQPLAGPLKARVVGVSPPHAAPAADAAQGWTYDAASLGGSNSLQPNQSSLPLRWNFHSPRASAFNFDVEISAQAAATVPAGAGATINGPGGTSVTVPPGSLPYDAVIDIAPAPASEVVAPLGRLEFVGAVRLTVTPVNAAAAALLPPSKPFQVSLPLPATTTATKFIVGRQTLCDDPRGPAPGLRQRLVATDTAVSDGESIVTQANVFPGVLTGGLLVVVANHGSGYVKGTVSDDDGPRAGAVVSNDTNELVSLTDTAGQYTLYINGGPFTLTAFDPLRLSGGTAAGDIAESGSTVSADLTMTPLAAPTNTRDGIRNGGFEHDNMLGWTATGAYEAVQHFGPTSNGTVILPTEGKWMVDISTGGGSVGGVGSGIKQKFKVPAGASTLRFDFNFISEEFPEFVNSSFDDSFHAVIRTPDGETTFARVSVNDSGSFQLVGDCNFPGGDSTCGQTGWREGSVDLSGYAGTNDPVEVELVFSANDAGDNAYDTHVLVDNLRFSTLWVDAKIVLGANAFPARVESEVAEANDILSQVGVNVRLRGVSLVADPDNKLLDLNVTWLPECGIFDFFGCPSHLTDEMAVLLPQSRSAVATDLNIYYVRSFFPESAAGIAVWPDSYHNVEINTNAGAIFTNNNTGVGLAHEIGHILITTLAGHKLEHLAEEGNLMFETPIPPYDLTREQSADINGSGNPLLLP